MMTPPPTSSTLFPYTTLFRSNLDPDADRGVAGVPHEVSHQGVIDHALEPGDEVLQHRGPGEHPDGARCCRTSSRSEEHTSELQSRQYLVCRLLLEKKKKKHNY